MKTVLEAKGNPLNANLEAVVVGVQHWHQLLFDSKTACVNCGTKDTALMHSLRNVKDRLEETTNLVQSGGNTLMGSSAHPQNMFWLK